MAISSAGVGSGLNVESIISQLTALEKRPLTTLQTKAAGIQAKLSSVGVIKSQISALSNAAFKLTLDGSWSGVTVGSAKPSAVTGTVTGVAAATSFAVDVTQLAKAQSVASSAVPTGTSMGTGKLTIDLGAWDFSGNPPTFSSSPSSSVSVDILAGEDSLTAIASKINDANAGVSATVLKDASGERLLVRSKSTGEDTSFRITVSNDSDTNDSDDSGLSRLAFDLAAAAPPVAPSTVPKASYGMGKNDYQQGLNALAKINGVEVTSASNSLADTIPGLTLQLSEVTTQSVQVTLASDTATMRKNIDAFVTAYNELNKTLVDATKYDSETKIAGVLQGDSIAFGLKNAMRNLLGSSALGTTFSRLSDVGFGLSVNGDLSVSGSKLDEAMKDVDGLKKLFNIDNGNPQTNGLALKMKDFARGLLAADGTVANKLDALNTAVSRNTSEQNKVNDRVSMVEARLRKQYTALDAKMAGLTALNTYMTQQVAQWNKTS